MKIITIGLIFLIASNLYSQNQDFTIQGIWEVGEENSQIEIAKNNDIWEGRLYSSNEDSAPIGLLILKELQMNNDVWTGKIYSAKRDTWYKIEIQPSTDKLNIKVFAGIFRKSMKWPRSTV